LYHGGQGKNILLAHRGQGKVEHISSD
jgi:hypothetical protein